MLYLSQRFCAQAARPWVRLVCSAYLLLGASASGWAAPPPPVDGNSLATLFFSPAERRALTAERRGDINSQPSRQITLDGVVKRDRASSTVWLNGQATPEGQSAGLPRVAITEAARVTLDGRSLRVGETLDLNTGASTDLVRPGAVRKAGPHE